MDDRIGSPRHAPLVTASHRPRLRGASHQVAFYVALAAGGLLVATAPGTRARVADGIYAVAITGLFGVSALLHRRTWTPAARRRMQLVDRVMIYVAIAGTYTPIALLALRGTAATVVLWLVWAGTLVASALQTVPVRAPKWAVAAPYVLMGWIATFAFPEMLRALGFAGFSLVVAGGLFYTGGAIVYGRRRPDPVPHVFGYHEVFHAMVVAGAFCHYLVVAFLV